MGEGSMTMPAKTANFSVRLPEETKEKIDALAKALGRPRNYVIAEAVERYIKEEAWQIEEIQAAIAEDDADLVVPHDDVMRAAYDAIDEIEKRRVS